MMLTSLRVVKTLEKSLTAILTSVKTARLCQAVDGVSMSTVYPNNLRNVIVRAWRPRHR
jgi:hypothetical protein